MLKISVPSSYLKMRLLILYEQGHKDPVHRVANETGAHQRLVRQVWRQLKEENQHVNQ